MLQRIIDFSHQLLKNSIDPGDIVIDATAGNGNDTMFLSGLAGETGRVLAFDIQVQAIAAVQEKLAEHQIENTRVIQDGHENVAFYLCKEEQIGGAIFNLGYLPGSDKTIITRGESTIKALRDMLEILKKQGIIVLVIYHGHEGGAQEKNAILHFVMALSQKKFNVLQYGFINQKNNPPFIIAIEKN